MLLLHFGVTPYLVFDGAPLPMKQGTHEERKARREKALKEAQKLLSEGRRKEACQLFKKSLEITLDVVQQVAKVTYPELILPQLASHTALQILTTKGHQCLIAPYEADAQLTYLMKLKKISAVVTEDSDLLVFGCDTVIFKLKPSGEGVLVKRNDLRKIPGFQGWSHDKIRHMCILSGCDYLPSLPTVGLKVAKRMLSCSNDIKKTLQYLRRSGKMKNRPNYEAEFQKADETFLYQAVYNPDSKQLFPLNVPEDPLAWFESMQNKIPDHLRAEDKDIAPKLDSSATGTTTSNSANDDSNTDAKSKQTNIPSRKFIDNVDWVEANKENLPPYFWNKQIKSEPKSTRPVSEDTPTRPPIPAALLFKAFNDKRITSISMAAKMTEEPSVNNGMRSIHSKALNISNRPTAIKRKASEEVSSIAPKRRALGSLQNM